MLRKHQAELQRIAIDIRTGRSRATNILAHVTPGGGKSAFGMIIAKELAEPLGYKICWVVPRDALRRQGELNFTEQKQLFGHSSVIRATDNATAIGAYALVQASNSLVLGQIPTPTKVGIGTTIPLNTFSVSPVDYAVGTISQTASATVVGSGTTFTAAMVGDQLIYADGVTDTVTGFTDATHITVTTSRTHSSSAYRLHYIGLQVQSNGTTYAQGNSATQLQVKNGQGVAVLNVDTANGQLQLGNYNGGTNAVAGKLVLNNTTNANGLTIVAGATASNYTLTLPTSAGSSSPSPAW
jgi:hypothetical protein